jgi:hypothetical protein
MALPLSRLTPRFNRPDIPDPTKPGDPGGAPIGPHDPGSGLGLEQDEGGPETERLDPHQWERAQQARAYASSGGRFGYRLNQQFGTGDPGGRLIAAARHGHLTFQDLPPPTYPETDPHHAGEVVPNQASMETITPPWNHHPTYQLAQGDKLLSRLRTMEVGGERRNLMRQNRGGV